MTTKKIQARNVREAMVLIKGTFGPDAIILSRNDIPDGVEFLVTDEFNKQATIKNHDDNAIINATSKIVDIHSPSEIALKSLHHEMMGIKSLLQEQMSELIWEQKKRRSPIQAMVIKQLLQVGFDTSVATRIASNIHNENSALMEPMIMNIMQALPLELAVNSLQSGVLVVYGITGVGKTTIVAKLAAQYALKYGSTSVAIISTDTNKIGANEALKIYANILNITFRVVENFSTMQEVLTTLKEKKFILIDTPGMSPKAKNSLEENLKLITLFPVSNKLLAIPANLQLTEINEIIKFYNEANITGLVLTKTDEAIHFGNIISSSIKQQLPIAYVTNGSKIPDDIEIFNAKKMLMKLFKNANAVDITETSLARMYANNS